MQLATRDQLEREVAGPTNNQQTAEHFTSDESNHDALSESIPLQSPQDLQIVARATNDAVRDWDVKTGRLFWPQGLESLLGYRSPRHICADAGLSRRSVAEADRSSVAEEIGFWQQQVHPEDLPAVMSSIADALAGTGEHWSGEYRFRRADGAYLL